MGFDNFFVFFLIGLDLKFLIFLFLLLLVFVFVMVFSFFYINIYLFFVIFLILIVLFLLRIVFFVVSLRNHFFYFFWDMLGLVSFVLVLYYGTWVSLSGSLETLLSNRFGDLFLFLLVVSGDLFFRNYFGSFFCLFLLFLAASTKSVQFPFFGWLIKAMEAPTPVRSLVHRRTLVTGGYFLVIFFMAEEPYYFIYFLLLFSFVRIFISSFLAILELDIKQFVAWSTISQVSLVFLFFSCGYYFYSFLHLLRHAFFKSLLFLQIGFLIIFNSGDQDYRKIKSFFCYNHIIMSFFISIFSLIALFFLGGMISKDLFLDFFLEKGFIFLFRVIILFLIFLTFFYSFKMLIFLSRTLESLKFSSSIVFLRVDFFFILKTFFFINWMRELFLIRGFYSNIVFFGWFFFVFFIFFVFVVYSFFSLFVSLNFFSEFFFYYILSIFYFFVCFEFIGFNLTQIIMEFFLWVFLFLKNLFKIKVFYFCLFVLLLYTYSLSRIFIFGIRGFGIPGLL